MAKWDVVKVMVYCDISFLSEYVLACTGVEFNIQVCNALLRVKLENGEAFTPAEALSDIEQKRQLIPNRVGFVTVTVV